MPDGILDYGEGDVKGRDAIIKVIYNEGSAKWQYKGGKNPAW